MRWPASDVSRWQTNDAGAAAGTVVLAMHLLHVTLEIREHGKAALAVGTWKFLDSIFNKGTVAATQVRAEGMKVI